MTSLPAATQSCCTRELKHLMWHTMARLAPAFRTAPPSLGPSPLEQFSGQVSLSLMMNML